MNKFEMFYNFCGHLDSKLKLDYKESNLKNEGVTFPQFCIVAFVQMLEDSSQVLNIKPNKKRTK